MLLTERCSSTFIARLTHEIEYFGQDGLEMCAWEETSRKHSITWFSTSGQCFGVKKKPTIKINFLNPGHETFYALWRPHGSSEEHGYMGNHGPSKNTMYYRYAVVAWPAAQDVRNALQFINTEAAVNALKTQKPIDAGALGEIMSKIQAKLEKKKYRPKPISTEFCQAICEVLVTAGDVAVVSKFFRKSFNKLCARLQDCKTVIPVLVSMLRSLNWNDVGAAVLESLGQMHRPTSVAISVFVANGLDDGEAKTALMQFAMEKAVQLSNGLASCSARCAEILWKWAFCLDDTDALNTFADKMMKLQPTSVDVATQALVQCSQEMAAKGDRPAALKAIADNWVSWLKAQIQDLEKPFSWEMPDAKFPGNAQVQTFLRGPAESMTTKEVRSSKLRRASVVHDGSLGGGWYGICDHHEDESVVFCAPEETIAVHDGAQCFDHALRSS